MDIKTESQNQPIIAPLILGTAGHVDHGKTSLVKNLTNFNTDRHPEEQKRGLSIDFAVAPYSTKEGTIIGIIDVPGHEDFIKNAISGASSVDILILVIAADDGIMPQTLEHLHVAKYLGVKKIIPVLTKIDLVDETTKLIAKEEIKELLEKMLVDHTDIFEISNTALIGIEELSNQIDKIIDDYGIAKDDAALSKAFRFFIRARFSSKGYGDIVTGVPSSGKINVNESLELFHHSKPSSTNVSVRGIQNYKHSTESTSAHISSAINLRDSDSSLLTRGSVLCTPGVYEQTRTAICWIQNDLGVIKRGKTYFIHLGTFSSEVTIIPLEQNELKIGENGPAQIRFKTPVVTSPQDRFIIRTNQTIAGGVILSRDGKLPRKSFRNLLSNGATKAIETIDEKSGNLISELLTSAPLLVTIKDLEILSSYSFKKDQLDDFALVRIGKDLWLNSYRSSYFKLSTKSILKRYHREKPLSSGMQLSLFLKLLTNKRNTSPVFEEKLLREVFEHYAACKIKNGLISLKDFEAAITEAEAKLIDQINKTLEQSGHIAKKNLSSDLSIDDKSLNKLIKFLESEKIVRSVSTYVFKYDYLDAIKIILINELPATGFSLNEFREKTSTSRNIAVTILEHLDNEGFTKRHGDQRIVQISKA